LSKARPIYYATAGPIYLDTATIETAGQHEPQDIPYLIVATKTSPRPRQPRTRPSTNETRCAQPV
jgi:hypothetical protein